jgi:hypothetical protein
MASGKALYLESGLLSVFRGTNLPFAGADSAWVALFVGNPEGAGAEVTTVASGYARFEIPNGTGEWSAPSGTPTAIDNTNPVTFGPATLSWGTVDYVALMDSDTGGSDNMLYSGALTTPKTIGVADSAQFAAGNLQISED